MDEIEQRQKEAVNKTYSFFETKTWIVILKIMRILTFIGIFLILYYLITEIESVKLLANDPCKICLKQLNESEFLHRICYPQGNILIQ